MTVNQLRYSKEEFARRGKEIYESQVRPQVEEGNHGKIAEFKCGPAEFARLNDAVDEFADLEEEGEQESPMFVVLN